ncbi:MAG TPA: TfuA-like protein [Longimicrobium sp.]|nr:TfuA-like protein [Longimicrobium sp.]
MKAVIFLGPSLPLDEAREVLDAVYLPPARQSDLVSAVRIHHPDVIGLVDGEFGQSLSVWHKEILYALERGIPVYGASSMGALRAAETEVFGTVGVGEVFRLYASGEVSGDDEVAVAHATGEAGYRVLSEPMVNLRLAFRRAREAGVITAGECERLTAIGKSLFFPERSFARVFRLAGEQGAIAPDALERVRAWVADNPRDQKREDALELLRTLRGLPTPVPPHQPTFRLERTPAFMALFDRDRRVLHDGVEVPLAAVADWAALHLPDFGEIAFAALNRSLARVLADVLEVSPDEADVDHEARRFRARRRLADQAALDRWLERNDLEPGEFRELMRNLAEARTLHRWLRARRGSRGVTSELLDELRLRGLYEDAAARAAVQERIVSENHPHLREMVDGVGDTLGLVVGHLRATGIRMDAPFPEWAEDVGFARTDDMRLELLRARAAREHLGKMVLGLAAALDGGNGGNGNGGHAATADASAAPAAAGAPAAGDASVRSAAPDGDHAPAGGDAAGRADDAPADADRPDLLDHAEMSAARPVAVEG